MLQSFLFGSWARNRFPELHRIPGSIFVPCFWTMTIQQWTDRRVAQDPLKSFKEGKYEWLRLRVEVVKAFLVVWCENTLRLWDYFGQRHTVKNNERHGWQLELKDCQNVSRQTSIKRSASDSVTTWTVFFPGNDHQPGACWQDPWLVICCGVTPHNWRFSRVWSYGLLYPVVNHNPIFHWYDPGSKCEVDEVANDLPISW